MVTNENNESVSCNIQALSTVHRVICFILTANFKEIANLEQPSFCGYLLFSGFGLLHVVRLPGTNNFFWLTCPLPVSLSDFYSKSTIGKQTTNNNDFFFYKIIDILNVASLLTNIKFRRCRLPTCYMRLYE